MTPMMRRIGDVGVPHTIYYLVDLLDFLRPVDPEAVFDLIAMLFSKAAPATGTSLSLWRPIVLPRLWVSIWRTTVGSSPIPSGAKS